MEKKLILASASPRRKELLSVAGYEFSIIPSNVNLAAAEIELIGVERKEFILKNAVDFVN